MSVHFGAGGAKNVKEIYIGVDGVARKVKEGYIGVSGPPRLFYRSSPLPEGYKIIEYIQSTGGTTGGYIDTGRTPSSGLKIILDIEPLTASPSSENNKMPMICGVYYRFYGSTSSANEGHYSYYVGWGETGVRGRLSYNSSTGPTPPSSSVIGGGGTPRRMTISMSMGTSSSTITVDDKSWTDSGEVKFFWKNAIYLLACNSALGSSGQGSSAADVFKTRIAAKLYSCQIYSYKTLVSDYVPCVNPRGLVGLYDLVDKTFKSSGASFIAGPLI